MDELRKVRLLRDADESRWPFMIPEEFWRPGRELELAGAICNARRMIPPYEPPRKPESEAPHDG